MLTHSDAGPFASKLPIRRAATALSKPQLCLFVLRNTSIEKDRKNPSLKWADINRSQSFQTSSRMPVLAPSRVDRSRLEAAIADVWTRDILSSQNATVRPRDGHTQRPSASSIIRKISVASFSSTFGRRSLGRTSVHKGSQGTDRTPPNTASLPKSFRATDYTRHAGLEDRPFGNDDEAKLMKTSLEENASTFLDVFFDKYEIGPCYFTGPAVQIDAKSTDHESESTAVEHASRYGVTRFVEDIGQGEKRRHLGMNMGSDGIPAAISSADLALDGMEETHSGNTTVSSSCMDEMMLPLVRWAPPKPPATHMRRWLAKPLFHRNSLHHRLNRA